MACKWNQSITKWYFTKKKVLPSDMYVKHERSVVDRKDPYFENFWSYLFPLSSEFYMKRTYFCMGFCQRWHTQHCPMLYLLVNTLYSNQSLTQSNLGKYWSLKSVIIQLWPTYISYMIVDVWYCPLGHSSHSEGFSAARLTIGKNSSCQKIILFFEQVYNCIELCAVL